MLSPEKFKLLLHKYTADTASASERKELMEAIASGLYDQQLSGDILQHLRDQSPAGEDIPPHVAADIFHKILLSEQQNELLLPAIKKRRIIRASVAVAAIVAALVLTVHFFTTGDDEQPLFAGASPQTPVTRTAPNPRSRQVVLPDGSKVTLEAGATLQYPAGFLPGRREVYLNGAAFFEVTKHPDQPFFVYCGNIVTRVLGTSFTIRPNERDHQLEVSVKTGKVEVYEKSAASGVNENNNGVILLPNQKVIYEETGGQFVAAIADRPVPVTRIDSAAVSIQQGIFDETPFARVLEYLQGSYGIDILVEDEGMYHCVFSGDISRQDFFTRLDVLCQATGASYEIKGTRILIKGRGCNQN